MNIQIPKFAAGLAVGCLVVSTSYAEDKQPAPAEILTRDGVRLKVEESEDAVTDSGFGGGSVRSVPSRSVSWSYSSTESEPKGPVTYLGIAADAVSDELAAQLPVDAGIGLVVRTIGSDSPAAKAGIQVNDVLTKIDDQVLVHPKQLQVLIRNRKEGDSVGLTFVRKGETKTAKAELVRREIKETRTLYGNRNNDERIRELISASRHQLAIPGMPPDLQPLFQKQTVIMGPDGKMTRLGADIDLDRLKRDLEKELEKSGLAEDIRKKVAEALQKTQSSLKKIEEEGHKAARDAAKAAESTGKR